MISFQERLSALVDVTAEITRAECPCGTCMGDGCADCGQSGIDRESLKAIRRAFARCLEIASGAKPEKIQQLGLALQYWGDEEPSTEEDTDGKQ